MKSGRYLFIYFVLGGAFVELISSQNELSREDNCPPKCLCFSTTVRCMFLQLRYIPRIPTSTTILDLRFNKIRSIPANSFSSLKNLNTLLLNNNHLSKLQDGAFDGLDNLRYLYLYKNRIRQIEPSVFKNLVKLEQLYLHFNDLVTFDTQTFDKLESLERLFLHNNRLQSIPRGAFKNLRSLKRLRLDSNALVCDCQLMWLAEMVKEKRERTQVAATCEFPTILQGKSLSSLADAEFHCKGLPEITEEPSDVEVNFGGTAYFSCKVDGEPQPEVVWLYNNEVISENPRISVLNDGTLMVEDAQENDVGFYECKAINDMGEAHSRKVQILIPKAEETQTEQVTTRPRFLRVPVNKIGTVGSSVEFECQVEGIPKPEIIWTKDNDIVFPESRIQISNDDLIISSVRLEDAGTYICQAANSFGRITATASLQIRALPRFVIEPRDVFTTEGGTAVFSCEAEGNPAPLISWFRNDAPIAPSGRFNIFAGGNRLRIQEVKRFDEGEFSCVAENDGGSVNAKAALFVRDKLAPIIKREPRDTIVERGEHVELECYAQGLPLPLITWRKDGQTMAEDDKHSIDSDGSLHVFNVSPEDEGLYECSASNYVGYAAARATLSLEKRPQIHLGDEFLEQSYKEALKKVNDAHNDTISQLFNRDRSRPPDPHELLRIFRFPQYEGRNIAKIAETIEQTLEIVQRHVESGMKFNLTGFTYEDLLSPTKLRTLSDLSGCLGHRRTVSECEDMCFHLKYRSIDGTCNNLEHPMWGASLIGFRREVGPIYENGFNTPVGWTKTKKYYGHFKPSARVVSTRLLTTENTTPDDHCTHMLMQWGQFLDHDLDHALPSISTKSFKAGVPCGESCDYSAPCFPIEIPTDDPRVRHRCMEFTRSSAVCGSGMSSVFFDKVLPREQINQLTSYIDGSQIYSSSNLELRNLRNLTFSSGELRGGLFGSTGKRLMPFSNGLPIDCRRDHTESSIDCFLGGDIRANEQVGLLAMHMIWFREHNRIARELREINPHWDSDTIFHEARKIVGAEVQHITFVHWLPHFLGESGVEALGKFTGYDPNIEATISNAFATAAFRIGHTIINPELERLNSTFQPIREGPLPLHKAFFSPWRVVEEGGIDPILRGLFVAPAKSKKPGQLLNLELTEKLFESAHVIALDLAAINIQRGRDHALPGYLEWRRFCNLSVPETFNDLEADISTREVRVKLRQLYGHPGNIDLFVGGVLEDKIEGARMGPTFSCILSHQFRRLRDGDRFYYENPWVFKPEQLAEIKKASLSRVLCDNGDDIGDVTKDAFVLPQEQTPSFVSCAKIPRVDLRLWTECSKDSDERRDDFNNFDRLSNRLRRQAEEYSYKDEKEFFLNELENRPENLVEATNQSFIPSEHLHSKVESDHLYKSAGSSSLEDHLDSNYRKKSISEGTSNDPLEGYVKDVTEERIEGIEAVVEQLSNTVEYLVKKIRRLEHAHSLKETSRKQFCKDENDVTRKRGEAWHKEECVRCVCRPRGIKCNVINCPELTCESPVKETGSCCPTC